MKLMLKEFWAKNKYRIIHELGIWITMSLGFAGAFGQEILQKIYYGDYSAETLKALKFLVITSLISGVLMRIFPELFPLYRKDVGILPAKNEPEKTTIENENKERETVI